MPFIEADSILAQARSQEYYIIVTEAIVCGVPANPRPSAPQVPTIWIRSGFVRLRAKPIRCVCNDLQRIAMD